MLVSDKFHMDAELSCSRVLILVLVDVGLGHAKAKAEALYAEKS